MQSEYAVLDFNLIGTSSRGRSLSSAFLARSSSDLVA